MAPGDTRILSSLFFAGVRFGAAIAGFRSGSGDEDGLPCGFNDMSQVAFLCDFHGRL